MEQALDALISQTFTDTDTEAETPSHTETETLHETNVMMKAKAQAKTFADAETQEGPSADALRALVRKGGRRKLEDERRRQTYWLSEEEIRMVDELAEATGAAKYEVVSAAIRELHHKVLCSED